MNHNISYPIKNSYLISEDVDIILKNEVIDGSALCNDTINFIKLKENANEKYILGQISSSELLELIRESENEYRKKYHNEVHNGNQYIEKFYDAVNIKYQNLVKSI